MNDKLVSIAKDIESMKIRGAGRIAVAAAKALKVAAMGSSAAGIDDFINEMKVSARYLVQTRPTAVSLPNAVRYVLINGLTENEGDLDVLKDSVIGAADRFISNAEDALRLIGDFGANRILSGDKIMTICNSNAAIEIMKRAHQQGKDIEVYAMETRPRYQGRITAKALANEGIDVNIAVDSAARFYMKDMDHVIVGADAVTSNGAVVNKIGTATVAMAAREARVRLMVAAETFKFHPDTLVGELVEIEERTPDEVIPQEIADEFSNIRVRNPVFDITPDEYVDIIVTEKGIIPPQASFYLLTQLYGWKLMDQDPWE
ncbi:MAG TPA: ribose 1,5-bisphosphate isomerase [Candidatus Methanofastidiosa archaeon]|nr:ribose 1,5-bisphosphate isomerase [Candidatus Methanofastidiosa archaeon]